MLVDVAQNLVKYVVFGALLQKYPMDRLLVLSSLKGYYVSDYWHRWHQIYVTRNHGNTYTLFMLYRRHHSDSAYL